MLSLAILAAAGFEISCGTTDRQTPPKNPTPRLPSEWVNIVMMK